LLRKKNFFILHFVHENKNVLYAIREAFSSKTAKAGKTASKVFIQENYDFLALITKVSGTCTAINWKNPIKTVK
jgi:hypothetical protein